MFDMRTRLCRPFHCAGLAVAVILVYAIDARAATPVTLPGIEAWQTEDIKADASGAAEGGGAELTLPMNYKIGRAVSPAVPVSAGQLYTFSANASTEYKFESQPAMYRFWLQLEAMDGKRVVATSVSPEMVGNTSPGPLAVTAVVPEGATHLRAVLCAQNKLWSLVENKAFVSEWRLLKLDGGAGGPLTLELVEPLPPKLGERTVRLRVSGNWPDQTALAISTSRGRTANVTMMTGGKADVQIKYAPDDVGAATVGASVLTESPTLRIADPAAAAFTLHRVTANGHDTPVLVQLTKDGKMMPGRYQSSVPGIFVTPPWSIDLAPGQWQLSIMRGPHYKPFRRDLDLSRGQAERLERVDLERVVDPAKHKWFGGDADGDVYHGERIYTDVSARTAADIGQAMGLEWLGVGLWGEPRPQTWADVKRETNALSNPNMLFSWTEERPKSTQGHACFIGLTRPDGDKAGWGWVGATRALENHETLHVIRSSGGATFVNHPLRWWMTGGKFRSNMYAALPFDLCAAGLLDGLNINEGQDALKLWSMLLDNGYRVAATAGADFCLDRPSGPMPGAARLYAYCPQGLSQASLSQAIRNQNTIVSTGPTLLADIDGSPPGTTLAAGKAYQIKIRGWARADEPDELQQVELWAHGKALATTKFKKGTSDATVAMDWKPKGPWDWVSVRLTSRRGWAMTSAFYAADPSWQPPEPVECTLTLQVAGLKPEFYPKTVVEVWDGAPSAVTSKLISKQTLTASSQELVAPAAGSVVVRAPDGRTKEVSVYDAAGIRAIVDEIAKGAKRAEPLLDWSTYERVLKQCRQATAKVQF